MTMVDSLAITIPTLLAIIGTIISVQNYKMNKKKNDKKDIQEEEERQKQNEIRLVSIEKDVQYIRIKVDKFDDKIEEHDKRLTKLESQVNIK